MGCQLAIRSPPLAVPFFLLLVVSAQQVEPTSAGDKTHCLVVSATQEEWSWWRLVGMVARVKVRVLASFSLSPPQLCVGRTYFLSLKVDGQRWTTATAATITVPSVSVSVSLSLLVPLSLSLSVLLEKGDEEGREPPLCVSCVWKEKGLQLPLFFWGLLSFLFFSSFSTHLFPYFLAK